MSSSPPFAGSHVPPATASSPPDAKRRSSTRWAAVRTRSRQERIVARELSARGIDCFLPVVKRQREYASCAAAVSVPVFDGWVFVADSAATTVSTAGPAPSCAFDGSLQGDRVVEAVRPPDPGRLERELSEIALAATRISAAQKIQWCPAIEGGLRAEVRRGPLVGLLGVTPRAGCGKVYFQVSAIGRAIAVDVPPEYVEIVGPAGGSEKCPASGARPA